MLDHNLSTSTSVLTHAHHTTRSLLSDGRAPSLLNGGLEEAQIPFFVFGAFAIAGFDRVPVAFAPGASVCAIAASVSRGPLSFFADAVDGRGRANRASSSGS